MSILLYTLSKINNFIAHRNVFHQLNPILQTPQDEYEFAEELITLPEASSYVEHKNWINFTKLNFPRPIYLNLIRHPIQKVLSAYYYLRSPEVYAHYAKGQPQLASMSTENQTMTFNECVKRKVRPFCVFDAQTFYNRDWRRFSLHFCGNKDICKYVELIFLILNLKFLTVLAHFLDV